MIESVVADCARYDIPLFLEPLAYAIEPGPRPGSAEFAGMRRRIVIDTVRRLGALGPDVLKVQFPVHTRFETDRSAWTDACNELNEAALVPWALLSGGDPYELFRDQVMTACTAGASGFMVGRVLWGDFVSGSAVDQPRLMEDVVRPRFAELTSLAVAHGHDWRDRYQFPAIDERWFPTY